MGQTNEQERLFSIHADSLSKVCCEARGVFVCPICLGVFSFDKIGDLTIGHVWNKSMRGSTKRVGRQKVLLCSKCNSTSGSRGEGALADLREAEEKIATGQLADPAVQVVPPLGVGVPVDVPGRIGVEIEPEQKRARLFLPVHEGHPVYDPKAWQKAKQYLSQGGCSVIVREQYPAVEKWTLAQIGLLTSGYLLAFFAFGYGYVLQTSLDPVRALITRSFKVNVDERLDLEESKDTAVWPCKECNNVHPGIAFINPSPGEETPWHLQVSFRQYHVRLPAPVAFEFTRMPEQEAVSALWTRLGTGGEVFRQPDYRVEGYSVARR